MAESLPSSSNCKTTWKTDTFNFTWTIENITLLFYLDFKKIVSSCFPSGAGWIKTEQEQQPVSQSECNAIGSRIMPFSGEGQLSQEIGDYKCRLEINPIPDEKFQKRLNVKLHVLKIPVEEVIAEVRIEVKDIRSEEPLHSDTKKAAVSSKKMSFDLISFGPRGMYAIPGGVIVIQVEVKFHIADTKEC